MKGKTLWIVLTFLMLGILVTACGGSEGTTASTGALATNAQGEPIYSEQDVSEGHNLYAANCSACHGADANGIQNLGKGLIHNDFIQDQTDSELLDFLKAGRKANDPSNTTGVAMPPKGGNPALSDDQIEKIIAFLRSLQ